MPPLRSRKEDIHLLFRKFASDFSNKNNIPAIKLSEKAITIIENNNWPGNIRQLKNFTEKLSIIEEKRLLNEKDISAHFNQTKTSRSLIATNEDTKAQFSEREILYKILFDLKNDLNDLKQITKDLIQEKENNENFQINNAERIQRVYDQSNPLEIGQDEAKKSEIITQEIIEENLSLQENEYEIIQKALEKNEGKRKKAAKELGISERTLYRKIKQYDL